MEYFLVKAESIEPDTEAVRLARERLAERAKPPVVEPSRPVPGTVFRDTLKKGGQGPEMVVVPAGRFRMGDLQGVGNSDEKPVHTVTIAKSFAMGKYPVTFKEYDRFARATGRELPGDQGWGRGKRKRPVINISWEDAVAYCEWLSEQTSKRYRLPSEAEWEYAARAGTKTAYWWGDVIGRNRANCDGCGSQWDNRQTAPVGSFDPNPFGLYDLLGNVWEWVQDSWHENYAGAPTDGSAWLTGGDSGLRVIRGGCWGNVPWALRASTRLKDGPAYRSNALGFRLP